MIGSTSEALNFDILIFPNCFPTAIARFEIMPTEVQIEEKSFTLQDLSPFSSLTKGFD